MYYVKNVFWKFLANSSKITVIELIFWKNSRLVACNITKNELFQKSFQGFFQNNSLWVIVGRGFLTPPILWRPPYIAYPTFLKFCPTPPSCCLQLSHPLLFLMSCFFDWMADCAAFCYFIKWYYGFMSSLGTLVPNNLTQTHKDTRHTQEPIDWCTHINMY